jgi:hypothetical protein
MLRTIIYLYSVEGSTECNSAGGALSSVADIVAGHPIVAAAARLVAQVAAAVVVV